MQNRSASNPSLKQERAVLEERAALLARELEGASQAAMCEVVEFQLAHENYGIETSYVREVYPLKELTPLPGTPPFLRGIVNVRGQILAVVDIKTFFGLPEKGITDLNKIIIIHNGDMQMGILADAVMGVRAIASETIQTSLPTLTDVRGEYSKGITPERLILLDIAALLADERILVQDEIDAL